MEWIRCPFHHLDKLSIKLLTLASAGRNFGRDWTTYIVGCRNHLSLQILTPVPFPILQAISSLIRSEEKNIPPSVRWPATQAEPPKKKTLRNILPSKFDLPNYENYARDATPVLQEVLY